jgi:acetamidase/formamidase
MCRWDKNGQNIKMRGATGKGDGKHVLTGPIFLCGAEPGDVIEVQFSAVLCTSC